MKVLVPLLAGTESQAEFVEAIAAKAETILLLQIVDKEFMNKTSAAMGEVMKFKNVMNDIKKQLGSKKKKAEELTEWGNTIKKIISIATLQHVDKVVLAKQSTGFFSEVLDALKKEKITVEIVDVKEPESDRHKKLF